MTTTITAPAIRATPHPALAIAGLVLGNITLALGPWSVRLADTGPVAAGFWRLTLALPVLLALALANGQRVAPLPRPMLLMLLAAGAFFGLDLVAWNLGIPRTRLAHAGLFGNCSSLILMGWALISLRRWPGRGEWAALAMTLTGAAILFARSLDLSARSFAGDVLCLLAGLFYVVYLLMLRDARRRGGGDQAIGAWAAVFVASAAGAPLMLALALWLGEPVLPGPTHFGAGWAGLFHGGWAPLLALALGSQILGQGFLVYALRHVSALVVGLALLIQPIVGALVGRWAFDEHLTGLDALGMVLVAAALVLATAGEWNKA